MSRQDKNAALARSSFLYGGNARYIDDLYARFERDPGSVDADWQEFFRALKDDGADVQRAASGPSWQRPDRLAGARGELVSALSGDWEEVDKALAGKVAERAQAAGVELSSTHVQQATRDSIRALMLIRA
jgi:2-oxoglutarate dehydrogenase E1 component